MVSPLADLETMRAAPGETVPATVQSDPPEMLTVDVETAVDDPLFTVTLVDPLPAETLVEFCAVLV
ncbi:MAG TPA: hypothetical protein VKK19_12805 [Candidatus Dormibacteraeota bacterium]|nr:hypothetical protein [Candidatus Dormibacteraeota bacterium]